MSLTVSPWMGVKIAGRLMWDSLLAMIFGNPGVTFEAYEEINEHPNRSTFDHTDNRNT